MLAAATLLVNAMTFDSILENVQKLRVSHSTLNSQIIIECLFSSGIQMTWLSDCRIYFQRGENNYRNKQ